MAKLIPSRSAQTVLSAEFTFEFADTMVDVAGVTKDFKTVGTAVFEPINLPPKAIIVGGDVVTETAVTGSTAYNISVGDSVSATRYLGATDRVAAGRTALVPTGYVGDGENLRVTVAPTVAAATAGKVTVRVLYIMRDRWSETVTN
jgi:hypothetical protein